MNNRKLRAVSDNDAQFLTFLMNTDSVLNALNELPTQLEDWADAIREWNKDSDEEDFIISDGEIPVGWIGINNLESVDRVAYLKLAAILPGYQNKGIGYYAISQVIAMLRKRNYIKIALYTDQENHKARACYSKCGFEVTETFMEEMANGKVVARCKMELMLRKKALSDYQFINLRQQPTLRLDAARWFHSKWGVPQEAYLECMDAYLEHQTEYGWYLCLDGEQIVAGMGVIDNDFHDRKDLFPNVCAVYTEESHRSQGITGQLLDMVVEDLRAKGISPVYLLTDHTGFYERYGWEFFCLAQGDGEDTPSRLYIHR